MRQWVILVVSVVVLVGGAAGYMYERGGLKEYNKAVKVINTMPEEDRDKSWGEFAGVDQRGGERGILAGAWMGRVWVWQASGLKAYKVDKDTMYSVFDGCREDVREKMNKGVGNVIQREIFNDVQEWKKRTKTGNYVAVYVALPGNGGVEGNLREMYDYNFWLFMNTGIDRECEK